MDLPKYRQIEEYIKDQIFNGHKKIGDSVETEIELSKRFGVSVPTVNKAVKNLATQGYVKRIPGKGTFVLTSRVSKSLQRRGSFTEDMASVGMEAGSKLLNYTVIKASEVPTVASYLKLDDDDLLHYFSRLRTGDGTPIAISHSYISVKVIPAIDIESLNGSFKQFVASLGIEDGADIYIMSAELANEEQKELLGIEDTALLKNIHITYTTDKVPYEYIETYYISERFEYEMRSGFLAEQP